MVHRDNLILACVSKGIYIITRGDKVVGDVKREYYQDRKGYTQYHYVLTWREVPDSHETYRTLPDLCRNLKFVNYPGYNSILMTQDEKKKYGLTKRRSKRESWWL